MESVPSGWLWDLEQAHLPCLDFPIFNLSLRTGQPASEGSGSLE